MRAAAAALLALPVLACGSPDAAPARPPDVLLVVLDTLRADHVSAYGYPRPTTPRLDALAELGVVFEDVTAPAPWTWPSHASLFTGEPPWVHGARLRRQLPDRAGGPGAAGFAQWVERLRDDLPTLAERFSEAGYRTVALVVNDWLHPDLGLLRGFEVARLLGSDGAMIRAAADAIRDPDPRPLLLFVNAMSAHSPFREGPGPWALPDPGFLDPERAPDWVRPYLATGLPRGVHLPTIPAGDEIPGTARHAVGALEIPQDGLAYLVRLYDAGVRGADFALGRVLEPWIAAHPDSVVAVTSDHGEGFAEHGLLDHRIAVYPEMLRVPLVVAAPGRLPQGARVGSPVALQRLYATLIELAGIGSPPGSLVGLANGQDAPALPIAAAARPDLWGRRAGGRFAHRWQLYRDGPFALVFSPDAPGAGELYALGADPAMLRDLAAAQPERLAAIRADALRAFAAHDEVESDPLEIPTHVAEHLRMLGYGE